MKAISLQVIISSIRAKVDGSIGATFTTPELTHEEKALFFELQNKNLDAKFTPVDEPSEEYTIEKDVEQKTQGQRIRSVLFLIWKQNPEDLDFSEYYKNKTEKYIEYLKRKLDE